MKVPYSVVKDFYDVCCIYCYKEPVVYIGHVPYKSFYRSHGVFLGKFSLGRIDDIHFGCETAFYAFGNTKEDVYTKLYCQVKDYILWKFNTLGKHGAN